MNGQKLASLSGIQLLAVAVLQPTRRPHVSRVLNSNAKRFGSTAKRRKVA